MRTLGNKKGKIALLVMIFIATTKLYSRHVNTNKAKDNNPTPAAGCAQATAIATLDLNNVRTRIEGTGGSMWQDRPNNLADYEVPKRISQDDPKFTSIYAGALWMGGLDVNNQLKIAAVTFRAAGNDFWPGPLNKSTAEIDPQTCATYDRFYGVSRQMVDEFVAWFNCANDPTGSCDPNDLYPGYQIPKEILDYPGNGDPSLGQDEFLAPFFDRDGDAFYDPNSGDYPKYDLVGDIDCRTTRDIRLFGDTTIWFVFNDKGNVHSESQGPSIGMEIRGQAFGFATNDEVNNMTFYNYEMINRSTFTLKETYFGQWVDADLGNSSDDYVGCDAARGLGYCYNGDNNDEDNSGRPGYGTTPPAVGIDFFEGPFADDDGIDNPLTQVVQDALDSNGIPYGGLGIGYGDGIVDNERYGMRKFVYYSIGSGQFIGDGDPSSALDHYNYMRGRWRNGGAQMVWGGNGNQGSTPAANVLADLLFPGTSDPLYWSTRGIVPSIDATDWSEKTVGNPPGDRRFLESAGPFTLLPGAVNDLTVGVVWARATSGDEFASVSKLLVADDKAQALFDNCFKVAEGPDAPDVTFQELDRELILYISNNTVTSNNFNETYNVKNPDIAIPDTIDGVFQGSDRDKDTLKFYEFQGYQIFQVKNSSITVSELFNPDVSRLAAQVDIKDNITQLINYTFDENLKANVPQEMVNGNDEGIKHSFRFTTDLFATGDDNVLVNHKTYYYIAIAYGYNSYKFYDPLDPLKLDGQTKPYISSRKTSTGSGITSFAAIPHNPAPEADGTLSSAQYGDEPQITRIEGKGNGGNWLDLTSESEARIVTDNFYDYPTYKAGNGPIKVKVVDPLNVKAGTYTVAFKDTNSSTMGNLGDAYYLLTDPNNKVTSSTQTIAIENEQLFLDDGISITIKQVQHPGANTDLGSGSLEASIEFEDPSKRWLTGFSDRDGQTDANWIRSGSSAFGSGNPYASDSYDDHLAPSFLDPNQDFEDLINGTWSPYALVAYPRTTPVVVEDALGFGELSGLAVKAIAKLEFLQSVDIVFTKDKNKWTRCVVLEARNDVALASGGAKHMRLREGASVDKEGRSAGDAGYNAAEGDLVSSTGMGWFPGYAINVETGERLNMAFAEDSWLSGENGRDMVWNPTSNFVAGIDGELRMGGKHYVYVYRNNTASPSATQDTYDQGAGLHATMLAPNPGFTIGKGCIWAGIPMLAPGSTLLETTARVKLRVEKPYESFTTASTVNGGLPLYSFDMTGLDTKLSNELAIDSALLLMNVVPNPYYAYSEYENDKLDNRIKITNLPEECTISIYNVNGTLIRRFEKAGEKTSLDWDLKNFVNVPVASGVYLIHVDVPNVGERTLKWFGVMKPTDLNGF